MKRETLPPQLLIHIAQRHQNGSELAGCEPPAPQIRRRKKLEEAKDSIFVKCAGSVACTVALGLAPAAFCSNRKLKSKLVAAGVGVSTATTLLFRGAGYLLNQSQLKKDKQNCYKQFKQQFEDVESLLNKGLECDPVLVREVMLYRRDLIQVIEILSHDPAVCESAHLNFNTNYSVKSKDAIYSALYQSVATLNIDLAERYLVKEKCCLFDVKGLKAILVAKDRESYDALSSRYQRTLSEACEDIGLKLELVNGS